MKCVEFEELVENFGCDEATIDYLRGLAFTSGGAEILFVDLDDMQETHPQREALLERWQQFVTESEHDQDALSLQEEGGVAAALAERLTALEVVLGHIDHKISSGGGRDNSLERDVRELQKSLDRQRQLHDDFEELAQGVEAATGELLERSHRIESYFSSPRRDWLLYLVVALLMALQLWQAFA